MKVLIIGIAGSMGSRRIRCLNALGYYNIWGFDSDSDAATKCYLKYGVNVCYDKGTLKTWVSEEKFDVAFICVPPTKKQEYITLANTNNIPCHAEADIVSYEGEYYPSRTFVYHPAIKKIFKLLCGGVLGDIYTFNYHLGQHIRDWHKGADYSNYYAAKKETGACKEMFVFEMAWLSYLFGTPILAKALVSKRLDDAQVTADDVYCTIVSFANSYFYSGCPQCPSRTKTICKDMINGTVLIDIVSRPATRRLEIIGEKGTLVWDWTKGTIHIHYATGHVSKILINAGQAAKGYHPAIAEQMYIDEVKEVITDIEQGGHFKSYKYTPKDEAKIIKMLNKIQEGNG